MTHVVFDDIDDCEIVLPLQTITLFNGNDQYLVNDKYLINEDLYYKLIDIIKHGQYNTDILLETVE